MEKSEKWKQRLREKFREKFLPFLGKRRGDGMGLFWIGMMILAAGVVLFGRKAVRRNK